MQQTEEDRLEDVVNGTTEEREIDAESLFSVLGEGPIGRTIDRTFKMMSICEEVIDGYQSMHPVKADVIDDAFPYLKPSKPLLNAPFKVYRHHCTMLLGRVVTLGRVDADALNRPSEAEVLAVLMDGLDKGPLTETARHALVKLSKDVLPRDKRKELAPYEAQHYEDDKRAMDLIERTTEKLASIIGNRREA
jgi:hypothetical protein